MILYNGEIYNWGRNKSDTEWLVEAMKKGNLTEKLENADGMFAVTHISKSTSNSYSDKPDFKIDVYKDVIGEKHVYFLNNEYFAISSVPGALGKLAKLQLTKVIPSVLEEYACRRHFIHPLSTALENIKQVKPGNILSFNSDTWSCEHKEWINLETMLSYSLSDELREISDHEYINRTEELLKSTIQDMERTNRLKTNGLIVLTLR